MSRITDLAPYLCGVDTSIRSAMARLNETEHLFQLIVGADGQLLGTLTDGDVRRALLHGLALDTGVERCMNSEFIHGIAGAEAENQKLLVENRRLVDFLPVVDADRKPTEVMLRGPGRGEIAHALVMAGGFGRRLGERTKDTPKPLLPVGGKPIIEYAIGALEDAGVPDIHISVHYLSDQIKEYVSERNGRAQIAFVEEDAPLGTAGALGKLDRKFEKPILVMNGDVITNVDVNAIHEFHVRHQHDATIGVARHDIDVPYGVVRYGDDGLFSGIEEKPRISQFIAAGIYYLGPEFVSLVPKDGALDMPALLNLGREIGLKIGLFPIHEYWTDVGRPDDLVTAERTHRRHKKAADSTGRK